MLYSNFDCCVNFVDYNTAEKNSHEFYPYKGEQTEYKVTQFNEEAALVDAFSGELTVDRVLESPEEVVEFWQKTQYDNDLKLMFEEILTNRNVE